jgi:hypothetical protein
MLKICSVREGRRSLAAAATQRLRAVIQLKYFPPTMLQMTGIFQFKDNAHDTGSQ